MNQPCRGILVSVALVCAMPASAQEWAVVSSPQGSYSIEMPGPAQYEAVTKSGLTFHVYEWKGGDLTFLAKHADMPMGVALSPKQELLDAFEKAFVAQMGASVLSTQKLPDGEYAGRDVKVSLPSGRGMSLRILWNESQRRLLQLSVEAAKLDLLAEGQGKADAQRFFGSLAFAAPAPAHAGSANAPEPASSGTAAAAASAVPSANDVRLSRIIAPDKVVFEACMQKVEAANPMPAHLKEKRTDPGEEKQRNSEALAVFLKQFPGMMQCKGDFKRSATPKLEKAGATPDQVSDQIAVALGEKN